MMLHRYWITFAPSGKATSLNLGCGVTATTRGEAVEMVQEKVFPLFGERKIIGIAEDIDVSRLDPGHVLPNIGNPALKGIWFPAI